MLTILIVAFGRWSIQFELHPKWQFEELSLRHKAKHGTRTYDRVHVTSALLLACETFRSFAPKHPGLLRWEALLR
jgi:hypothetical protein